MAKRSNSQHVDGWDSNAQAMANIVENMFIQSPHGNDLSFKKPQGMHIFNVDIRKLSKLPYAIDRSNPNAMQDTMRMYNDLGYSCSRRDLHNNFKDYAKLLRLLNISTDIPAIYFFHGTNVPPEQLFPDENGNGGLNLDHAVGASFLGQRLYGSHAGKAAYFALPYLYLIMMLRDGPDGRHRSVTWVPDGSQRDIPEEVAIITTMTKTGSFGLEEKKRYDIRLNITTTTIQLVDDMFNYPEITIRETGSLYEAGIIPLACFCVDKPFLGRLPEMRHLDSLRRERIPMYVDMHYRDELAYQQANAKEHERLMRLARAQGLFRNKAALR